MRAMGFISLLHAVFAICSSNRHVNAETQPNNLLIGSPLAQPCYEGSRECATVQSGYGNETFRTSQFGAYINTQWETCQTNNSQCLLDSEDPSNPEPFSNHQSCNQGSVPAHYIDVRGPEDVRSAFTLVERTGVPLVIKNTGHDYKGRSSAPNSLALWMHNLQNISFKPSFVPDNCSLPSKPAVTMGAGVQWHTAYGFAENNNITLVGGSDATVGASGGWLMGGGHGALTNTMGMGVDRVLQFKVVTPDGKYRVVNKCQDPDLFFALRGGGGSTFAVVLESTVAASPVVTLPTIILPRPGNLSIENFWAILLENGERWAQEGWGGFITSEIVILLNPTLSDVDAVRSMQPLIGLGAILRTFPTWKAFFDFFTASNVAAVGKSLAMSSRLIPRTALATNDSRSSLISAMKHAHDNVGSFIALVAPPSSFLGDGSTSVTPAWRESVYHVTGVIEWAWNATREQKEQAYQNATAAFAPLRSITPNAAYSNEADVHQADHAEAFWGQANYQKLLKTKQKFDPRNILTCWQCVGWQSKDHRFTCYL